MNLELLRRDLWHGGQLLAFSGLDGKTDFISGMAVRTSFGCPGLDVKLPGSCRVRFPTLEMKSVLAGGDFLQLEYTFSAPVRVAFIDAYHLLIDGPCEVIDLSPLISSAKKDNLTLIGSSSNFEPSKLETDIDAVINDRGKWLSGIDVSLPSSHPTRKTLAKAFSLMKTQVCSPEGRILHRWTTPDRWPHRRMWLWDSVFHAIGWRHIDVSMARDAISAVLDMQVENGFIAHMMSPFETSQITQPPVLALGVKLVNDVSPCKDWVKWLYPKLVKYLEWDMSNRDSDGGGLLEWQIEGDPNCRSGESGMDNSPRFNSATIMDAVDFNSFLALECEIVSQLAASLGFCDEAEKWRNHHARLCRLIRDRLWSDKYRFFVDYDLGTDTQSDVLASSGFLPLICGAATKEQALHLARHLSDPQMFGTGFPIPSVARQDERHYSKDMWRGPTWINVNWLTAFGLDRYGLHESASSLRARTISEIEKYCSEYGVFFEFYDDRGELEPPKLLRKGKCAPEINPMHQVFHDYGWTATLYADIALSNKHSQI